MAIYDIYGNELVAESTRKKSFWNNKINFPYWVLHLDCARKYFSVENIKTLIDLIASAGFNQLQLHFSENEGFRLQLDDMIVRANGTSYDLTPCLGGTENSSKWYVQNEMDEIINYANSRGIDIIPSLDMPAHMGRILSTFPQFKYGTSNTIDIKNTSAVNFANAIAKKYAKYFSSRGCKYYCFGFDEIISYGNGFHVLYNNGEFQYVVDFANGLVEIVESCGMIPRAFNELVHYANDFDYFTSRNVEVLYWGYNIVNETLATPQTLQNMGYSIINSSSQYYWILGGRQVTAETLQSADLLVDFVGGGIQRNGNGAQFCVWCDSTSTQAGDNGSGVVAAITPLIAAFGVAINNATATL